MCLPKIVVVTPVKNEAWILDRFLAVTSQFADLIIISDQGSTDGSDEICQKFAKAVVIGNNSPRYDEAERQISLLRTARDLVPGPKVILALDADEILAANALTQPGWRTMMDAKPGTVLCFEKPDLYMRPDQCMRYDMPWPIGYVDDGAEHIPKKIHSIRIPMPLSAPRLAIHDVKVMHYAWTRWAGQAAKIRLYSVIENAQGITPSAVKRRFRYNSNEDYANTGKLEMTPPEWFCGWESMGIDMLTICSEKYYWQDFEVLRHFEQYGVQRFFGDDIWYFDWEACRRFAIAQGMTGMPQEPIVGPSSLKQAGSKLLDVSFGAFRRTKQMLLSKKNAPDWQ